jgi:hypothetical protein
MTGAFYINLSTAEFKFRSLPTFSKITFMSIQSLFNKIEHILYSDWNPMGGPGIPKNEYESYVPVIMKLKKEGASAETIAQTLHQIESEKMGKKGSLEHCRKVANKIMDLPEFFA